MTTRPGSASPRGARVSAVREALAYCGQPRHLRRTGRIALVVGVVLTGINQADVLIGGRATAITFVKVPLNFAVPLIVSSLGLLAGRRAHAAPGEPAALNRRCRPAHRRRS